MFYEIILNHRLTATKYQLDIFVVEEFSSAFQSKANVQCSKLVPYGVSYGLKQPKPRDIFEIRSYLEVNPDSEFQRIPWSSKQSIIKIQMPL